MLLEIAIGDAYGAGFEYADDDIVNENNDLSKYLQHQKHKSLKPGSYTDDTQMSIANAELLIEGREWTKLNLANKFVEVFKRDPRKGYASGLYNFLIEVSDGEEFLTRIIPYSDKSGAAMRAGPIGVLEDINDVIQYTTIQAKITHDTASGTNAAIAAALIPHYFLYENEKKENLGKFIEKYVPGEWNMPWKEKVGAQGYMSVRAAITAISERGSLSEILKRCVDFRGDVDTVAAIAMAGASCCKEVVQDLPIHLTENLENGHFGKDYLIDLDYKLRRLKK